MDSSQLDLQTRILRGAASFGALVIIVPLACAALSGVLIPHSPIATVLGLAMLPLSMFIGLLAWQGVEIDEFIHDLWCVLFIQRNNTLKRVYLDPRVYEYRIPGAAVLIPVPSFVCGVCGFLAAILSHLPIVATTLLYATLGLVYGILLFIVIWTWVLPLMAEARTL